MSVEVPEGWKTITLQDLLSLSAAGFWGKPEGEDEKEVRVLRATNFTKRGIDYSTAANRSFPLKKFAQKELTFGDILLECSGGSPTQPVGRVRRFEANSGYSFSNFFRVLRPKGSVVDGQFLLFVLDDFYERGGTEVLQKATTGIRNLSFTEYLATLISLPPLPEQQRIAEILSSVDESIRATEAVISQAERVKRGLMEDLLTGGLGSAAIANGEVPEGWRNSELRSLCIIAGEYGANAPKSEFDPDLPRYVRITDIDEDGNLLPDTLVSIPREVAEPYILEEGDIVIARSGATVGKSYMHIKSNGECAFAGYLVRFRADRNVANPKWIKFNLQSEYFWAWVRDNQRAGAQPNINAKEYGGLLLCVPPLPEQQRISEILSSVDDQITTNRATVEQLQRLKRGLMDDLLTGKVRTVA